MKETQLTYVLASELEAVLGIAGCFLIHVVHKLTEVRKENATQNTVILQIAYSDPQVTRVAPTSHNMRDSLTS